MDCVKGTYTDTAGLSECTKCPEGSYNDQPGSDQCTPCSPGTYNSNLQATKCHNCGIGNFSDESQMTECKQCAGGTYSAGESNTVCDNCVAGTYKEYYMQNLWLNSPTTEAKESEFAKWKEDGVMRWELSQGEESCSQTCGRQGMTCLQSTLSAGGIEMVRQCSNVNACPVQGVCPFVSAGESCYFGPTAACDVIVPAFLVGSGRGALCACGSDYSGLDALIATTPYMMTTTCIPCKPGLYSDDAASSCSLCSVGSVASADATACTICPVGQKWIRHGTSHGGPECVTCPAGTYQDTAGATTCESCLSGQISDAGASSCTPCPIGQYRDSENSCADCTPGTFTVSEEGSNTCTVCAPGSFQTEAGQSECHLCDAGKFSPQSESTENACQDCEAGYFSGEGASSCTICPAGSYSVLKGSSECTTCPTGKFLITPGASSADACQSCAEESYTANPGTAQCMYCNGTLLSTVTDFDVPGLSADTNYGCIHNCSAGYFSSTTEGDYGCKPCPVNTILREDNHQYTSCDSCTKAGFVTAGVGSTECECDAGYALIANSDDACVKCSGVKREYKTHIGNVSCDTCPEGLTMHMIGTVAHCKCAKGEYDEGLGPNQFCAKCPYGTTTLQSGGVGIRSCVCDPDPDMHLQPKTEIEGDMNAENECLCKTGYRQKAKNKCVECTATQVTENECNTQFSRSPRTSPRRDAWPITAIALVTHMALTYTLWFNEAM